MQKKEKYTDKAYRLKKQNSPLTFMLPTRNTKRYPLLWFDEETGVNKPLRYARNQRTKLWTEVVFETSQVESRSN